MTGRAALLALTGALVSFACATQDSSDSVAAPRTYDVRGLVRQIPDPAQGSAQLYIHHEAIDDFESETGELVGMDAMSMPFPLGETVAVEDVAVGDKIAFRLEVDWSRHPAARVVWVTRLPDDTQLEFRRARPDTEP